MSNLSEPLPLEPGFALHFTHLRAPEQSISFPCDGIGMVDLDELSEVQRRHYLYAHTLIGREYGMPVIAPPLTPVPRSALQSP
jgi:hypothetical protein